MSNVPDHTMLGGLLELGFELIPLHQWNAVGEGGKREGKRPLRLNWRKDPAMTPEEVVEHMGEMCNVGVRMAETVDDDGQRWVLLIVDVDPRAFPKPGEVGDDGLPLPPNPVAELERRFGFSLADYPTVLTGSNHPEHGRGRHHYTMARLPHDWAEGDRLKNTLQGLKGIEFKSVGRQVVAPGSVHPETGLHYEWSEFHPALEGAPPEAPAALVAALRTGRSTAPRAEGVDWTPAVLEAFLASIDPRSFRDHEEWLKVMIAANAATGGAGLEEFTAWSTRDPLYAHAGSTIAYRWDTFDPDKDGGRSVKTLEWVARKMGVDLPTAQLAAGDFAELALEEAAATGPDDEGRPRPPPVPDARETDLAYLRRTHFVYQEGGKTFVGRFEHDPDLNRSVLVRMSPSAFREYWSDRFTTLDDKKVEVGDAFMRTQKDKYTGLAFRPKEPARQRTHDGKLNLWTGFAFEPRAGGSWSMLQELVHEGIASGDAEHAGYILNWMARAVQVPELPGEVALVVKGKKGTGKGTLGSAFVRLFGNHGMQITSPSLLTGRFNAHMRDCIALFADEALWAGSKEGESVLKGLITEPRITFEGKGRDPEQGRNMLHIVMASNLDWVVPAGMDGERRYAVFEVSDRYQIRRGDPQADARRNWFAALHGQLENRDFAGYGRMLRDLLDRDISGWHPFDDMPATDALREQQLMGLSPLAEFVYQALREGDASMLRPYEDGWDDPEGVVRVVKADFHSAFLAWAKERGDLNRLFGLARETTVGRELRKMLGDAIVSRRLTAPPEGWHGGGLRPSEWVLAPLDECRSAWDKRAGGDTDWGSV